VDLCGELVLVVRMLKRLRRKRDDQMTSGFWVYKLVEDESGYFEVYKSETGINAVPGESGALMSPIEKPGSSYGVHRIQLLIIGFKSLSKM
jgi:hypothetical protein